MYFLPPCSAAYATLVVGPYYMSSVVSLYSANLLALLSTAQGPSDAAVCVALLREGRYVEGRYGDSVKLSHFVTFRTLRTPLWRQLTACP